MRKYLVPLFLLLAVVLGSFDLAAQRSVIRREGMRFPGAVERDAHGIARIAAWNRHDVYFLQGYIHAEDRLFQMDFTRRAASGTLAELVGSNALPNDVEARAIGLRRAAEASWNAFSPRAREALTAYAAGVNAGIADFPLPGEYAALELSRVEPWTPVDSVVIGKAIAFNLSFDLGDIDRTIALKTMIGAGEVLGFNGELLFFADLWNPMPFTSASTIPDSASAAGKGAPAAISSPLSDARSAASRLHPALIPLLQQYKADLSRTALMGHLGIEELQAGSNEWAIAASLAEEGKSLMANDPHLALTTPSTFYPIALKAGSLNVVGVGFPGVPFVILGRNEHIAWGATTNPLDVTDVYQEQVVPDPTAPAGLSTVSNGVTEWLLPILQTFRTNVIGNGTLDNLVVVPSGGDIPPAILIVPRKNAPIVSLDRENGVAVSVQYTGFWATRELEAFMLWDEATNLEEFQEGLELFDVGSQNWSVVDAEGNIAYFTSAEMPLREDLQSSTVNGLPPYLIRDGSGGNDWIRLENPPSGQAIPYQILPADEMPRVINPAAGWFVNANNDPAGTTLDGDPLNQLRPGGNGIYYLSPGYDGFRAGRITQMIRQHLDGGGRLSFAEMQQMQADTVMIDAQFFVPEIVASFERSRAPGAHPTLAALGSSPAVGAVVQRLAAWDFSTPTGVLAGYDASDVNGERVEPTQTEIANSVAATFYSVWRGQILKNTIDALFGEGRIPIAARPPASAALSALKRLFQTFPQTQGRGVSGMSFFNVPGVEDAGARRDILVLKSIADALELVTGDRFAAAFHKSADLNDYRWGMLHRVVFRHPIAPFLGIPPGAGASPHPFGAQIPGIPTDGGFGTVDAASHNPRADGVNEFMFGTGPVRRVVAEGGGGMMRSESSLPGGTSGRPSSPFYFNLLPMWLTNETYTQTLQTGFELPFGRR